MTDRERLIDAMAMASYASEVKQRKDIPQRWEDASAATQEFYRLDADEQLDAALAVTDENGVPVLGWVGEQVGWCHPEYGFTADATNIAPQPPWVPMFTFRVDVEDA